MMGSRLSDTSVYPRVCGGTLDKLEPALAVNGLSPRVRGNRTKRPGIVRVVGSIPACAGEPAIKVLTPPVTTVYPRVCGGTPW